MPVVMPDARASRDAQSSRDAQASVAHSDGAQPGNGNPARHTSNNVALLALSRARAHIADGSSAVFHCSPGRTA